MTYKVRVKGTYRIQHANGTLGPEVQVNKEVEVQSSVTDDNDVTKGDALEQIMDEIQKGVLPCPCRP